MTEVSGENRRIPRGEGDDSCEPAACPNSGCNQNLLDVDEDFWDPTPDVHCHKCGGAVKHIGFFVGSRKRGVHQFKCVSCGHRFGVRNPVMKRRCPNCKEEITMYWDYLMGGPRGRLSENANLISERPLRRAAAVVSRQVLIVALIAIIHRQHSYQNSSRGTGVPRLPPSIIHSVDRDIYWYAASTPYRWDFQVRTGPFQTA